MKESVSGCFFSEHSVDGHQIHTMPISGELKNL